jgi:hypothetical protein
MIKYENFRKWVEQNNGYRLFQLSDESIWTIRISKGNIEQYIHIHPGRYSPLSMRVKSESLKTAIAFWCIKFSMDQKPNKYELNFNNTLFKTLPNKETINIIRGYLNLSPVKKIDANSKVWNLFHLLNPSVDPFKIIKKI